jgi:hypothetical protein
MPTCVIGDAEFRSVGGKTDLFKKDAHELQSLVSMTHSLPMRVLILPPAIKFICIQAEPFSLSSEWFSKRSLRP